jgi:hypothetical protein
MAKSKILSLLLTIATFLSLTGCYTQFAVLDTPTTLGSSNQDTVQPAQENCVWERDFSGRPFLHCYSGTYPREWYGYNHSPWWYHRNRDSYDVDRCPPNYYFDRNCKCCRYYLNNPYYGGLSKTAAAPVDDAEPEKSDTAKTPQKVNVQVSNHHSVYVPIGGPNSERFTQTTTAQSGAASQAAPKPDSSHKTGGNPSTETNAAGSSNVNAPAGTSDAAPDQTPPEQPPKPKPLRRSIWSR